jgi:hypothetical protein
MALVARVYIARPVRVADVRPVLLCERAWRIFEGWNVNDGVSKEKSWCPIRPSGENHRDVRRLQVRIAKAVKESHRTEANTHPEWKEVFGPLPVRRQPAASRSYVAGKVNGAAKSYDPAYDR